MRKPNYNERKLSERVAKLSNQELYAFIASTTLLLVDRSNGDYDAEDILSACLNLCQAVRDK